jgi:hypothetical protein
MEGDVDVQLHHLQSKRDLVQALVTALLEKREERALGALSCLEPG